MVNVKGMNRAMAVTTAMPGSMPPMLPTASPMIMTSRLEGVMALSRPAMNRLNTSDSMGYLGESGFTLELLQSK